MASREQLIAESGIPIAEFLRCNAPFVPWHSSRDPLDRKVWEIERSEHGDLRKVAAKLGVDYESAVLAHRRAVRRWGDPRTLFRRDAMDYARSTSVQQASVRFGVLQPTLRYWLRRDASRSVNPYGQASGVAGA